MSNEYLNKALEEKQAAGKKIFIPYIMAGDGGLDVLEERLKFLQECGAAAIELGIPFSDPVADGPTIQDAGQRALKNGTTLTSILEKLKDFKERRSIPVILMTYLNPVYTYGVEKFAKDCYDSGVNGVIIPDLPLEEESIVTDTFRHASISLIRLAALTSPMNRLREIGQRTEGFLYAVSVTGTTGARATHHDKVRTYLQGLKEYTSTPVLAGFGVSTSDQAKELGNYCDGIIVGSKIVELLHQGELGVIKTLIQESI